MFRSDGLVQRRVASTVNNSTTENQKNEDEPSVNGGDYDSSKDTRFTLMEEVLLLGLKDKEVRISLSLAYLAMHLPNCFGLWIAGLHLVLE